MIKAALKRSCNLTNTPACYFRDMSNLTGKTKKRKRKKIDWNSQMAILAHYKSFVCLTLSWFIAKAVKVAAETSSNSYDIKNRTDVFPVRCSVIDSQKPP